jgi:hypothetical protein
MFDQSENQRRIHEAHVVYNQQAAASGWQVFRAQKLSL